MNVSWRTGLVIVCAALLTAGCGRRQAVDSVATGQPIEVPNDTGGYAGDMANPPKEQVQPDLERNIEMGAYTDSRDPEFVNREALKRAAEEQRKAEGEEEPPPPSDTSRDDDWDSVAQPVVALEFSKGVVYLELWPDVAPKHVENLLKLADAKFYDGVRVHRVDPGFVVQMGDPLSKMLPLEDPQMGSGGTGEKLKAEFSDKPHLRGTLAMARSADPNSASSQFYICLDRAEHLDKKYTVFGKVLGEGMVVIDQIERGDRLYYARVVHR